MQRDDLENLLRAVAEGRIRPEEALRSLGTATADLGFARIDHGRDLRCGFPEVVFCPGKSPEMAARLAREIFERSGRVLLTRVDAEQVEAVRGVLPQVHYHEEARLLHAESGRRRESGLVGVISAGTADRPVAEEAALVAEAMGSRVRRAYDCGVAGLHRLGAEIDLLREARALVVVAGMEGALPSVVAGLTDRPVIGVPTSVGYGTSFGGLSALLGMLNTCAAGLTVVNIDNGFGAGYAAAVINRMVASAEESETET